MEHYVTAMLWSSTDESDESGGVPMDENYTLDDLTPDAWEQVESDCRDFLESVGEHITAENYIGRNTSGASVLALAGHDFWLTRNGHGAGFWDGDWRSELKDADWNPGPMTKASKDAGELDPWIDENGKVELG
jgi:hypothetical protein